MKFELTEKQSEILDIREAEQNAELVKIQKETWENPSDTVIDLWNNGLPYLGVSGGALAYIFIPTSLGVIITVTYEATNAEIDLTEYENW